MKKIAYVGIDYHQNTLTIAVRLEDEQKIHDTTRIKNEDKIIRKYLKQLSKEFDIRACYEASSSGYYFQRKMESWGYHCEVIAPTSLPKKRGERRKNDLRDAITLAKNYANGDLSIVHLPTEKEESIRALVRCRWTFKENEKRAKQNINSLLCCHGLRWSRSKWTVAHLKWLWTLKMPNEYLQIVLDEHLVHLEQIQCPSVNEIRGLSSVHPEMGDFGGLGKLRDPQQRQNGPYVMAHLRLNQECFINESRIDGPFSKGHERTTIFLSYWFVSIHF